MESPDDRTKRLLAEAGWAKRLAHALVRNADLADDVAQDTLLAALRAPPTSAMQEMRAWLQTTMRRIARRTLAQQQWRAERDRATARLSADDEEQRTHERLRLHYLLCAAVESLPEPYRTAVWLRFVDGLSPRAVARRLDVTSEVVRQRVHRGLAMLRERLDREFGDRRAWVAALPALGMVANPASVLAVLTMKKVLVAAAVVLVAGSVWMIVSPSTPDAIARQSAAAPVASGQDGALADATTTNTRVEEKPADVAAPGVDARSLEVLVVDKATDKPVPGAEVGWYDETAQPRMMAVAAKMEAFEVMDFYGDPESLALRFGWRTKTDVDGVAKIAASGSVTAVARLEKRFGMASIAPASKERDRCRIELEVDRNLFVQVLEADGKPAPGIPVDVMHLPPTNQGAPRFLSWMWTTRPDGIARLHHLQTRKQPWDGCPVDPQGQFSVRLDWQAFWDCASPIDWWSPPSDVMVLRLPLCGTVLARTERNGKPIHTDWCVLYEGDDNNAYSWSQQAKAASDGWVHFAHVRCNHPFKLQASGMISSSYPEHDGPRFPGQELRVSIPVSDDHVLVSGRLLGADHAPIAEASVMAEVDLCGRVGAVMIRTDRDGHFEQLQYNVGETASVLRRFCIRWMGATASITPRKFPPGDIDLGDITLSSDAVLASGDFLEDDVPCAEPIEFFIQRRGADDRWQEAEGVAPTQDHGHFLVSGPSTPGRYRLVFNGNNVLPFAPVEFDAGQTNLKVQVVRGASLEATLMVPTAIGNTWGLQVTIVHPSEAAPDRNFLADDVRKNWLRGVPHPAVEGKQTITWPPQSPGQYSIEFRLWGDPKPLIVIDNVCLPLPASGDPRLRDIDLHDRIARLSIRLLSPGGEPLRKDGLALLAPRQSEECAEIRGGECEMLVRPGPVDLLVCVIGYRPTEVHGVLGQVDVTLQPWAQAQLTFPELPALPAGAVLEAFLQAQDSASFRYRSRSSSGSGHSLQPESEITEVRDGAVTLTVGTGVQALHLAIAAPDHSKYVPVAGFTPAIQPSTTPIQVRIPTAALQAAIDKWNGGR